MLGVNLLRIKDKTEIGLENGYSDNPCIVSVNYAEINGVFKSVTNANAQTQKVIEPNGNDAFLLTDILVSANKVNGSTVTLQITDGVNTETIAVFDSGNNSVNLAHAFKGNWAGWQGADLEVVTDTNLQTATVAVGYARITQDKALTYAEWSARR